MMSAPAERPRRVGIFGGTFDPIHLGHLLLAEEARYQLSLDTVLLVPAGDPPHKQDREITAVHHRLCMVELATVAEDYLHISRVDAERPGPHFAVDMVQRLYDEAQTTTEFFFLMGLDSLRELPRWHQADWLVAHCRLAVLNRPEVTIDWEKLEQALPGVRKSVQRLSMPEIAIASHALRRRVAHGQPIRHQVPVAVEAYIYKYGLYR